MVAPDLAWANPMTTIATPCINVCTLDPESKRCLGCGRTIEEIAQWTLLSDEDRARVMAELPARLASVCSPETAAG